MTGKVTPLEMPTLDTPDRRQKCGLKLGESRQRVTVIAAVIQRKRKVSRGGGC